MKLEPRGYFSRTWPTSEGFKADCPRCGNPDHSLAWSDRKGVGCCFHASCPWYYQSGGVTAYRLAAFFGNGFEYKVPDNIVEAEDAEVTLPKEFKLFNELRGNIRATLYAYLSSRGIPRKVVDRAMLGYCETGSRWGYIIMPIFDIDSGDVVYWQARRFKEREPKFYNPKYSRKSELIYTISKARKPSKAIVVESVMNALTLENFSTDTVIFAILGKSLSQVQQDKLLCIEKTLREITLALDGDARKDMIAMAAKQLGYAGKVVKIASIPNDEDINSLGRQRAWQLVRDATVYDAYDPRNRISSSQGKA